MDKYKKILIMTSVKAEQDAVCAGLDSAPGFDVTLCGVGIASAAAQTAVALTKAKYDLVINIGIGGGFKEKADLSSVVIAKKIIAPELGTKTGDGFIGLDELDFGTTSFIPDRQVIYRLTRRLIEVPINVSTGDILTVSTITGTKDDEIRLRDRYKDAKAEAMEGFGVATAADIFGVPMIEIRAVSNVIGPRNRDAWKIKEALDSITIISSMFPEVF